MPNAQCPMANAERRLALQENAEAAEAAEGLTLIGPGCVQRKSPGTSARALVHFRCIAFRFSLCITPPSARRHQS